MKVIQETAKIFNTVIGEQKITNDAKYRLLVFCIHLKYDNDVNLIFNNLTKEMVVLTDYEYAFLTNENISISESFIQELIKKWFLVPIDHDDYKLSQQVVSLARQFTDKSYINSFTVTTTTACNARCFYCFEAGAKVSTMSADTALDVAKYIIENSKGNYFNITWFGGEPLCNKNAMNIISKYLKENNADFSSYMITNGYLFNKETIAQEKELWNLKQLQITLDGMPDTYRKVKNYVNGDKDPFTRVINNIEDLLKCGIKVIARINMDRHNEEELYKLVDLLHNRFSKYEKFSLYAHLLFEESGFTPLKRSDDQRLDIADKFAKLSEYIYSLKLYGKIRFVSNDVKKSFCMADNCQAIMISPEGKIGKCEHFVDSKFIGSIYEPKVQEIWDDYFYEKKCEICPCQPSCLQLKSCPENSVCYEFNKQQRLTVLKRQMVSTYENSVKN